MLTAEQVKHAILEILPDGEAAYTEAAALKKAREAAEARRKTTYDRANRLLSVYLDLLDGAYTPESRVLQERIDKLY
jgi:hypothetical protein